MHTHNRHAELSSFLLYHPRQQSFVHEPFSGQGIYLTMEVNDVNMVCNNLKKQGVEIEVELRDEPWGDRHFAIQDPNGIGIDIVKYSPPQE